MKIICIGRNYIDHAKEMNSPLPDKPIFFLKADSAILLNNKPFYLPDFSQEVHYEAELVVKISRNGKYIQPEFAHRYYEEVAIGIDFTARDLQIEAKAKGLPWTPAKAFDGSAPLSSFLAKKELGAFEHLSFYLDLNGKRVQTGFVSEMIFPIDSLIAYISRFMTLKMGDLIFTGTPAGVGPVSVGDHLKAGINDEMLMNFFVR